MTNNQEQASIDPATSTINMMEASRILHVFVLINFRKITKKSSPNPVVLIMSKKALCLEIPCTTQTDL